VSLVWWLQILNCMQCDTQTELERSDVYHVCKSRVTNMASLRNFEIVSDVLPVGAECEPNEWFYETYVLVVVVVDRVGSG
jgi:hypothetical protein